MKLKSYKELIVWQKSVQLAVKIYKITDRYPKSELYGLTHQTRKSAVSIPSNIAEGSTRQHLQEYLQFLNVALASAAELETQLIIARELTYLRPEESDSFAEMLVEITKMLNVLIRKLRTNP